jgi:hypothetical protein
MKNGKNIEKEILKRIFNCSQEELEQILLCYQNFEEKLYQYPIQQLMPTIFEEAEESLERNHYDYIVGSMQEEFITQYFAKKGVSLDFEFYEMFFESLSEIEKYISEYGITTDEWEKFRAEYESLLE